MPESIKIGPIEAVRKFVEGFNNGDVELAQAACAHQISIIDDFPPYGWQGGGAMTGWFRDLARMSTEHGMSDPWVTLREPLQVEMTDRKAYMVVPIDVGWLQNGARAERTGFMTIVLWEEAEGWRISACAWTWN
ncbi:MAG TPA: hypothetical protein VI193_12485 [Acidimicrobiia bacterium]